MALNNDDGKYTGSEMDYTYGDAKQKMQSRTDDLAILLRKLPSHAMSLAYDFFNNRHHPSKNEELTEIAGMLPYNSPLRNQAQAHTVSMLFNSLEHPPASYLGHEHQYRTADASHHNFLFPDFGKAKMPYARTVRSAKKLHGVKPDAGMLFDLLQARSSESFKENEAGISSMFLYHADILIHDLFNTNRENSTISDTSSYLDLAPLYGSNQEEQNRVRLGRDGLLKPDTFHEDRLLGQPPGVTVLLVLYNRFHNYVATMLKEINEDERFALLDNNEKGIAKLDNDLFQTARLVVGGLYINICLGDYLRAIQGVHEKDTTWNFDPRMYIEKTSQGEKVPRGMGNQVSCEFNLLYRFHSALSKRDEKWTEAFMRHQAATRLPQLADISEDDINLEELSPRDFGIMLNSFAKEIRAIEPCKRNIEGLKRGPDGKFDDGELARLLKESIDDNAGAFGARNVPKALKAIEIAGIHAARRWEVASLNEFRQFFGLEPHISFRDVNKDPHIQEALENLYDSPDMIEMYPGIFIEGIEKADCADEKHTKLKGVGFPRTAARGVLSDAVTLVRSDRFYTIDYTTATLTNWGLCEAAADYKTLGGSMFYKLLLRGLPGFFDFNSVYAMQPMYTSRANKDILTRLKTIDQFSLKPPEALKVVATIESHDLVQTIMKDRDFFKSPWESSIGKLVSKSAFDGLNAFESKYHPSGAKQIYLDYLVEKAEALVQKDIFSFQEFGNTHHLVDIVRDVAIPLNARFLAEMFSLNRKGNSNKWGAHTSSELYKMLIEVRNWVDYPNSDPTSMWYRRRKAQESAAELTRTTKMSVPKAAAEPWAILSFFWGNQAKTEDQNLSTLRKLAASIAKSLQGLGQGEEDTAQMAWMLAVSGVGTTVTAFAEVLDYFLSPSFEHPMDQTQEDANAEKQRLWSEVQNLAMQNSDIANSQLEKYFMEALRLTSEQMCRRTVKENLGNLNLANHELKPDQDVILLVSNANKDGEAFSNPHRFSLDRDPSEYLHFNYGPSGPLGEDMLLAYGTALLKVAGQMGGLRKAPGQMGELKRVQLNKDSTKLAQVHGRHYMTPDWGYLVAEPTTWKMYFDSFKGKTLVKKTSA